MTRSRRAGLSREEVRQQPLYARVLGLQYLAPSGFLCFVFLEGAVALGILLALAELVSWWGVLVLPVSVAVMVKLNDVVAGALTVSSAARTSRAREAGARTVRLPAAVLSRASRNAPSNPRVAGDATVSSRPSESGAPTEPGAPSGTQPSSAAAGALPLNALDGVLPASTADTVSPADAVSTADTLSNADGVSAATRAARDIPAFDVSTSFAASSAARDIPDFSVAPVSRTIDDPAIDPLSAPGPVPDSMPTVDLLGRLSETRSGLSEARVGPSETQGGPSETRGRIPGAREQDREAPASNFRSRRSARRAAKRQDAYESPAHDPEKTQRLQGVHGEDRRQTSADSYWAAEPSARSLDPFRPLDAPHRFTEVTAPPESSGVNAARPGRQWAEQWDDEQRARQSATRRYE